MSSYRKKVLIVGSGGREHALAWRLAQSPKVEKLYVAPGNAGTAATGENVSIKATDIGGLFMFAEREKIDLTVVGPDDPLAMGIADAFQARGFRIFGPAKAAARIEASKAFAKQFMLEQGIPTADFRTFRNLRSAVAYAETVSHPLVVKASGLALGKGVIVCETREETSNALRLIMRDRIFGAAGNEVVIEEYLEGQEISIHALSDGYYYVMFPPSQDHKRACEGDTGPNTGGMGTIAPVPWVSVQDMRAIEDSIVLPAIDGMRKRKTPFVGCLYPGLMMTSAGPRALEFNARFGDPETQVYMRLLKTDILDIIEACIDGKLKNVKVEWRPGFAACVVLASAGYPGEYKKGFEISGVAEAEQIPGVIVFQAGTAIQDGKLVTSGGRVLGVSAVGDTLREALDRAYKAVKRIHFEGMEYRKDIGVKSLDEEIKF